MTNRTLAPATGLVASFDLSSVYQSPPALHVLTNQQLTSIVTAACTGGIQFAKSQSVTRWCPDPTCDKLGNFFFLRDLNSGSHWSLGYQPTCTEPAEYQVSFTPGTVTLERADQDINSKLEICVHPTLNIDLRRITLVNRSQETRHIEVTSYSEIVLQDPFADRGHPAFSKLFVETQVLDEGMLLAHRRPRGSHERTIFASHFIIDERNEFEGIQWETSRSEFIGRARSLINPAAMTSSSSLSGTVGSVLDPIFSLRKALILSPGESVQLTWCLGSEHSKASLLEAAARLRDPHAVDEAFLNADQAAVDQLADWQLSPEDMPEMLLVASRRVHGLSDTYLADQNSEPVVNGLHNAHAPEDSKVAKYLEHLGITPAVAPIQRSIKNALPKTNAPLLSDRGKPHQVVLGAHEEVLKLDNGIGGFSADGREYVIHLRPQGDGTLKLPPLPWNNVISNKNFGFIASETGAGYTWAYNSRLNRLTPWQNDPIIDPHSEVFYLRDESTGEYWSLTPGPIPQPTSYEVRHGWGYSTYRHSYDGLEQEVCQFVPIEDPVKITRIRLTNRGDQPRKFRLFNYVQWELSDGRPLDALHTETSLDSERPAIYAVNNTRAEYAGHVAFAAFGGPALEHSLTADRTEFLGMHRSTSNPLAVETGRSLARRAGNSLDPGAAIQTALTIGPGETLQCSFLLGETPSRENSQELIDAYLSVEAVNDALDAVKAFWIDTLTAVQIETPVPAIDLLVNGWLPYQNLSCRFWGRSSSYQSGGAYGFRDQLQDSAALVHHWPELTREQILRNAAHQFVEGDVLHWWHPPNSTGIRTAFADDLLWLPLVASEYVLKTGDQSLWQEDVRFITSEPLPPGEPEIFLTPQDSGQTGTLYEHCCRALDRGLTSGANGLPLMGSGDWNDGMNRVGQGGRGESVWLGFFIDFILQRMLPFCKQQGDSENFEKYSAYREQLRIALNDAGWDGSWYRRAYFDDGTPLGTAAADECCIDALVQAWAVMSGVAPAERAASAIAAAEERLVDEQAGIIRLLDPPFDKMKNDPGYIKGYLPGVRENGGQYTHGVLWLIRAIAELGQGSRACQLLEMLSPASHGNSPDTVDVYKAEPYVVAADVYGVAPHVGRAGWSWYTGSAGWMFRVAVESLLGIHPENGTHLRVDPCISAGWPECRVQYRLPDRKTVYHIHIQNPTGKERGVSSATVDGNVTEVAENGALVSVVQDGREHQVVVLL